MAAILSLPQCADRVSYPHIIIAAGGPCLQVHVGRSQLCRSPDQSDQGVPTVDIVGVVGGIVGRDDLSRNCC